MNDNEKIKIIKQSIGLSILGGTYFIVRSAIENNVERRGLLQESLVLCARLGITMAVASAAEKQINPMVEYIYKQVTKTEKDIS